MSTIEVRKPWTKRHEISDAIDVSQSFYNAGEKEIKYITFSYLAYNSVKDIVSCTVSGKTEVNGKLTGPIPPKHESYVTWNSMWFNPTVSTVVLTRMYIQFMDNTEELIEGKDIVYMDDEKSMYYQNITLPNLELQKREKAIKEAIEKLSRQKATADGIKEVFLEYKDNEKTLLEILDKIYIKNSNGYLIGDYIEKEYSSNEAFMGKAVAFWKSSIAYQQMYYNMPDVKELTNYPEKYSKKIKKYEPAYVMPRKSGCITYKKGILELTNGIKYHDKY